MNIVFHRRDLRTQDNKALEAAGEKAAPIYIFDPEEWNHELSLDARKEFVLESLKDLNRQYIRLGTELTLFHGEPVDILTRLKSDNHKVIFNEDRNHFFQEKERKLREKFTPVNENTVISRKSGRPEKWANNAKYWFESKQCERPESINENNLDGNTSLDEIRERYSISPEKEGFGKGGASRRKRGWKSLLKILMITPDVFLHLPRLKALPLTYHLISDMAVSLPVRSTRE